MTTNKKLVVELDSSDFEAILVALDAFQNQRHAGVLEGINHAPETHAPDPGK